MELRYNQREQELQQVCVLNLSAVYFHTKHKLITMFHIVDDCSDTPSGGAGAAGGGNTLEETGSGEGQ